MLAAGGALTGAALPGALLAARAAATVASAAGDTREALRAAARIVALEYRVVLFAAGRDPAAIGGAEAAREEGLGAAAARAVAAGGGGDARTVASTLAGALAAAALEADALDAERWFSNPSLDSADLPAAFAFDGGGGAGDPLEPRPERVVRAAASQRARANA